MFLGAFGGSLGNAYQNYTPGGINKKHLLTPSCMHFGVMHLLRIPWAAWRSNQSVPKEINPEDSLEGLMLKLKLQYFGHLIRRADSLEKTMCWERLKAEEKGMIEDEMTEWHHQFNGREFEQTLGDSKGEGSLACCSPWGHKELDATEQLNKNSV